VIHNYFAIQDQLILLANYSGSIIDPYYQYAFLDFHPNYSSQPNNFASIYLPFFDGEWWSVMIKKTGTGVSTNFELYAGNKMYESGENGTSIGFFPHPQL
jgi:hypothetical protein